MHSIKMKGMASLVGDIQDDIIKAPFGQHLDTEVIEDGFLKPKRHLYPAAQMINHNGPSGNERVMNATAPLK